LNSAFERTRADGHRYCGGHYEFQGVSAKTSVLAIGSDFILQFIERLIANELQDEFAFRDQRLLIGSAPDQAPFEVASAQT
jgi:hypothetical protein